MAKDTPETAFTKAQAAQALIDTLTADIKKKQAERKVGQADLKAHRKAVLDALGRKPRGPRKAKEHVVAESVPDRDFREIGE